MIDVQALLDGVVGDEAKAWLDAARADLAERGTQHLPVPWAQLARRLGRARLAG